MLLTELREFTDADFRSLAEIEDDVCLSIFIPNAGGEQASLGHGAASLKNLFRQASAELDGANLPPAEMDDFMEPVKDLLVAPIWHGTEQSVAAFRTRQGFHSFFVPQSVQPRAVAGKRFFLKPLIPSLTRTRRYYVIALSDNAVRIFHCREADCVELHSAKIPGGLEEAVGARSFAPSLQAHSSRASGKHVLTYHGHSGPVEDIHENRLIYCQFVDSAFDELIGQSEEPLVVAAVKELFFDFRRVSKYPHLLDEPIPGNPDRLTPAVLHEAAQKIVDSDGQKQLANALLRYTEMRATPWASDNAESIFRAAYEGRIRTVFIAEDAEIWCSSDQLIGSVAIGEQGPGREELLNLIVAQTLRHGGLAYSLPLDSMPSRKPVAAEFRTL